MRSYKVSESHVEVEREKNKTAKVELGKEQASAERPRSPNVSKRSNCSGQQLNKLNSNQSAAEPAEANRSAAEQKLFSSSLSGGV